MCYFLKNVCFSIGLMKYWHFSICHAFKVLGNSPMYAKFIQCDLKKIWKTLCNFESFQFVYDFEMLRNVQLGATFIHCDLIGCSKSKKNLVRFQHFHFVYDLRLLTSVGQMGALCNVQIHQKIKIVDISLDQCKKHDSPKIEPKACTLTNRAPWSIEKSKMLIFR